MTYLAWALCVVGVIASLRVIATVAYDVLTMPVGEVD